MAMQPQIMVDRVSHGIVQAAAIATERRELYTMSDERFIKTWNLDTGQHVRTIDAHRGKITALVWVSNLRFLASTSLDHSLAVWSFKGECVARAKFPSAIYSAEYSTKHNAFLVGGVKKMFVVKLVQNRDDWDFLVDKEFSEHTDFISQIVCSPMGRIFSCGYDGVICAFEQNVSEELVVYTVGHGEDQIRARAKCHKGAITCSTFNFETGTLITGGYDMLVKIWNADSLTAHAQYIPLSTLDLNRTILSLAYVDATRMVWVGTAGSHHPHLMDPRTGTNLTDFQPQITLKEPFPGEHPTCLVATSGTEAISVSDNKRITIWKYNPLACVASIHGHTDWVELLLSHPTSSQWGFVSGGADSTVRSWHSPSALYPELYSLKDLYQGHEGSVVAGVIKADGTILFTAGDDMTIRGWTLQEEGPGGQQQQSGATGAQQRGNAQQANAPDALAMICGNTQSGAEAASERKDERKEVVPEERAPLAPKSASQPVPEAETEGAPATTFLTEGAEVGGTRAAPAASAGVGAGATLSRSVGAGLEVMYVRQGVPPDKPVGKRKVQPAHLSRLPSAATPGPTAKPGGGAAAAQSNNNASLGGQGGQSNNNGGDLGQSCVMTLEGHTARITALCLLDHYLISVSADHSVRVWDSNTGTLWKTIEDAHESEV